MILKDICIIRMGHSFRSRLEPQPNGQILVIQPKDISPDGTLSNADICRVDITPGKFLNKNDVLLINRGRFTAHVFEDNLGMPCMATSAFLILTPRSPAQLLSAYVSLYFNSATGQSVIKRLNETTTIPFISLGNLESVDIPAPSLEKQQKLVALDQAKQRFAQLTARKVDLLNDLINNQLKA